MDRWKAEQGRGREKRKITREKSRRERVRRKKMQMREKVGKSRFTVFFQWFVAPECRKVGSLKRRVRSQLARWEMKKCTPLWREAHFQVKMYKAHHSRTTFKSWDVEKVHAVVARSTFPSQNVQNTSAPDHFWKLRCRKSARRCGAKHISKSKCTKTHQLRTTFGSWDVEKVHTVVARSTFPSQNVQITPAPDHFWKLRCRKSARRCGAKHISKSKCIKHTMFGPLFKVQMSKKCTPFWREVHFEVKMLKTPGIRTTFKGSNVASLHYTTLHYITLHYTTLHYTTFHHTSLHHTPLHYNYNYTTTPHYTPLHSTTRHHTTPHYITLHYTTFHYTSLQYPTLHSTTLQLQLHNDTTTRLHSTTLHYTKLHYTTLHSITLHSTTLQLKLHNYTTTLHYITLHYTTLHYTTLHYTTLHYTTLPSTTLHYITLHYNYNYNYKTTLHYTKLHYTTQHYTTLHYTTLHYTTLHSTTLHYTTLHYTTLHYTEWHCTTDRQVDR